MDVQKLVEDLRSKGIQLRRRGQKLKWKAPQGTMTADVKGMLKNHKAEILKLIDNRKLIKLPRDKEIAELINSDCHDVLDSLPNNSIDLLVTDPPYGFSFMGKDWDRAIPSVEIWEECLRVLKPGAFAFIMSAPRQDLLCRMILSLEEAGFDTERTPIYWTFASGFPKAHNVGKMHKHLKGAYAGYQPKPAVEVILVAMKPAKHGTYEAQALDNGKGVTYLDDCRIPYADKADAEQVNANFTGDEYNVGLTWGGTKRLGNNFNQAGRFPGNLLVSDKVLANHSRFYSLDSWAESRLPFLIVPKASKRERLAGLEVMQSQAIESQEQGRRAVEKPSDVHPKSEKNPHPTVKPIKLFSYLITMGSREGDIVLDPFCGTGTTCIVAKMLNRRYIGVELKQEYYEVAKLRLQHAEMKKAG